METRANRAERPSDLKRLFVDTDEAAYILGIKRTKLFDLLRTKRLPSRKLDGKRLIPIAAIYKFAQELPDD